MKIEKNRHHSNQPPSSPELQSLRNSHQKRLLPFLSHHLRPLHKIIPNRQPQPLTRSRTIQIPHPVPLPLRTLPIHPPRRPHRLPQRKEHRTPQKQRRLPNPLTTLHRPQMIPIQRLPVVVIAQHARVEDLRDIAETGDFVGSGAAGEEVAGAGVPEGFFGCEEAETLEEGAFDLAIVYGGVD